MSSTHVNELLDAIHGTKLPEGRLRMEVDVKAVVSGIRKHYNFAISSEVAALAKQHKKIARARNARLIMSNEIPHEMLPEHVPYCIWYPDVPSEETCKQLVQQYPGMKYHVGRTCAVAGYVGLYRELDLLPDVSIAQEAREAGSTSLEIFEDITQRLVRYSVMDDYNRKVDLENPRSGAFINCDAAVRSTLEIRADVRPSEPYTAQSRGFRSHFDITEDGGIDDHDSDAQHNAPLAERHVPLLYSPLPLDLPTMNKDVLILMAAYEGNVDRYVRLRRPFMILGELESVIRGIYHNTTFAKWWSLQYKSCTTGNVGYIYNIGCAINARFIMNNDLSGVLTFGLPYLIWYPLWPRQETLAELAEMVPAMRLQIAQACIVADYRELYDTLGVRPSWILWEESKNSHNPYYKADLERRSAELGFDVSSMEEKSETRRLDINQWCTNRDKEPTDRFLWRELAAVDMTVEDGFGVYDEGIQANATDYNLFICSSESMRAQLPKEGDGWVLYQEYE